MYLQRCGNVAISRTNILEQRTTGVNYSRRISATHNSSHDAAIFCYYPAFPHSSSGSSDARSSPQLLIIYISYIRINTCSLHHDLFIIYIRAATRREESNPAMASAAGSSYFDSADSSSIFNDSVVNADYDDLNESDSCVAVGRRLFKMVNIILYIFG